MPTAGAPMLVDTELVPTTRKFEAYVTHITPSRKDPVNTENQNDDQWRFHFSYAMI